MKTITQDLFLAQIRSIENINVIDSSDKDFSKQELSDDDSFDYFQSLPSTKSSVDSVTISFFAIIKKEIGSDTWHCIVSARNENNSKKETISKDYDSYYKILTDSKNSISDLIAISLGNKTTTVDVASSQVTTNDTENISLDNIVGTWVGEPTIMKVLIMRSGRGFVIFSNGASMNIQIDVLRTTNSKFTVKIMQMNKFNASFYPDVQRQKVLDFASTATPIEWTLSLSKDGMLNGTKKTLVEDESGSIKETLVNVSWKKKA